MKMFDSITVSAIPADAPAVAGYVNGRWPTFPVLVKQFPKAHKLSIAVFASADAECLDVEPGDATPSQAPAWAKRQIQRGVKRPVIYCSLSQARTVTDAMARAGFKRHDYRLWTAHYTFHPHICSPKCGFGLMTNADGTQWTDKSMGRNLDESLVADDFFGVTPRPNPFPPQPANPDAKLKAWRERLRHVQALLRDKGTTPYMRAILKSYAAKLRVLIRGGK